MVKKLEQIKEKKDAEDTVITKSNTAFMRQYGKFALDSISTNKLIMPADYNPSNALMQAEVILRDEGIIYEKDGNTQIACTTDSLKKSLLTMLVLGLYPSFTHGYFINYGGKLTFQSSYLGNQVLAKRKGAFRIISNVIYQDDIFEMGNDPDTGKQFIIRHDTKFGNQDGNIIGAYCIITSVDGEKFTTIMTMQRIKKSWEMSTNKGNNKFQNKFPDEASKRTVINYACKYFIKTMLDRTEDLSLEYIGRDNFLEGEINEIEPQRIEQTYQNLQNEKDEIAIENIGFEEKIEAAEKIDEISNTDQIFPVSDDNENHIQTTSEEEQETINAGF